jgi:hypothetical protein
MRYPFRAAVLFILAMVLCGEGGPRLNNAVPESFEWQLTTSAMSHLLDNNDSFSMDNNFLVYDTRDTVGTGIGNGTSI